MIGEYPSYTDGAVVMGDEEELTPKPIVRKPFKNYPTPDRWARLLFRDYGVSPDRFIEKIDERYTWENLLARSEEIEDAAWTKTAATATANATLSPSGTLTADKLVEDGTNAIHRLSQAVTVGAGPLAAGVAVKAVGRNRVRLALYNATDGRFAEVSFDIRSRAYKVSAGTVLRVNMLDDGWAYIAFTGTASVTNSSLFIETETDGGSNSYAGDSASGLFIWRPTVVLGTAAPPLIDTTTGARSIVVPLMDASDPLAFLVDESDLAEDGENYARVRRIFARLPTTQVRDGTISFTKPNFPTNDFQGYWVDSVAQDATANVWSVAIAATSVSRFPSGGTFTLKYKTSTTAALNCTDSGGTISAAFNALADAVTDGLTVNTINNLSSTGQLDLARSTAGTSDWNQVSWNPAGLTPTCVTSAAQGGGFTYNFRAARAEVNVNKTGHGFSPGDPIRYNTVTTGGGTLTTVVSVPDANNFTVANASSTATVVPTYYRRFLRTYTPGPDNLAADIIERFYWPGLQAGIDTVDDIPVPTPGINDSTFLLAICDGTEKVVYNTTERAQWYGEVRRVTETQIRMTDA